MIVGAALSLPLLLPLFWFAGGPAAGIGLLRWDRRPESSTALPTPAET